MKKGFILFVIFLLFLVSITYVFGLVDDGWACNSNSDCKSGKCELLTSTKKACVGLNFWIGDCTTSAEEANYNYECSQDTIGQDVYWVCKDYLSLTYSVKPPVKVCSLAGYCTGTKDKVYCWLRKGASAPCQSDKECLSNLCASGSCASGWFGNCTKSGIDIIEGWHCKADHTGCISNSGEIRNCRTTAGFEMHCNDVLNSCESGLKLSEGESCTSSNQCNSNLCSTNKCALKKSNGQTCISSFECQSNNCWNGKCATVTSNWDGLCGSGLICSNDLSSCISSNGGTVKVCVTGKYCKPSTSGDGCAVKKTSGQTCVSSVECANDICQSGKCGKADGSSCGSSSECASNDCFGSMCRSNNAWVGGCSFVNTCSADETRCSVSTQGTQICNVNYFCKSGECFLKMADGSNCNLNIECNSGSCLNGLCFSPKNNGQTCSSALECKSGFCENLKCGKADGSSCSSNNQCASNDCYLVCRSSSSWIGSCPNPPGTCKDNTKCTISSQGIKTCNTKYYCKTGACVAKGVGGAACSNNFECASGSCTINTKTNTGTCTVVSLKPNGENCAANSECQSNSCLGGRCAEPLRAKGESCVLGSQCQTSFCINGVCDTPKLNGEVCSSNTDCFSNYCDVILSPRVCRSSPTINNLCGTNYNCNLDHDKCIPKSADDPIILCPVGASIPYYCLEAGGSANCGLQKKSNGLGCKENYECQSEICLNKICSATLKINGESCTMNSECQSGNCDTLMSFPNNNKCRPPAITQNICGNGYVCNDYFNRCLPQDVNKPIINCPVSAGIPYYCSGPGNSVNCGLQKKSDGLPCSNNYECQSEICLDNKCGSSEPEVCSQDSDCPGQKCSEVLNSCVLMDFCVGDLDCSQGQACNENDNKCSLDTDSDGIPNVVDTDDDNDGALDNIDSAPLDPDIGGTPGGGTGGGGGGSGGGGSGGGGSGGGGQVTPSCSNLGGIVCLGSEECEGSLILNAKETKCCEGSCGSKPVYVLQTDSSVTFVKSCLDTGQTYVTVKDKEGNTLMDANTLSSLGLTSGEYVDAEDYSCNKNLIGEGQPVYGYGLLSLFLSLSLLILFYSFRRRFI